MPDPTSPSSRPAASVGEPSRPGEPAGRSQGRRLLAASAATAAAVVALTAAGLATSANDVTMALLYTVLVLVATTWGGRAVGGAAALLTAFAFIWYWLPHQGIQSDDWVALGTFLAASTLVGHLVARARSEAETARARQQEVERLWVERERLLGETAHLEALRESEALKTGLLRAVSHDLRTPLTALRLQLETLERLLAGQAEPLLALGRLTREQQRLARRIDNLLAVARLEAGIARLHVEPVPPSWLFTQASESLSSILAERRVERFVAPGCPDLLVDPSLALEIIVNLLENAARAAGKGGALEVAAEAGAGGLVQVEVRDHGPGVPADVMRELEGGAPVRWETDDASPRNRLGLGLQIARSFAAAHGGALRLLPRAGGGTVARVELPAAAAVPAEVERLEVRV